MTLLNSLLQTTLCFFVLCHCNGLQQQCIGTCYSGQILPEPRDIVPNRHIKGHSYRNFTTDDSVKCHSFCVQDCRCKACQIKHGTGCELLDEHRYSKPRDFVAEQGYVYFDLRQTLHHGEPYRLLPMSCYNGCCTSQPCQNDGICTEHCTDPKLKFSCKCSPKSHWGNVCEKRFTSCLDVLKARDEDSSHVLEDGIYDIEVNGKPLPLYCAFNSSSKQAWTLIESVSRSNKAHFNTKPFFSATAINMKFPPNWKQYSLDAIAIKYIRSKATLFRATCDFPTRVKTSLLPDFLLGRLSDVDITANIPNGAQNICMLTYVAINALIARWLHMIRTTNMFTSMLLGLLAATVHLCQEMQTTLVTIALAKPILSFSAQELVTLRHSGGLGTRHEKEH